MFLINTVVAVVRATEVVLEGEWQSRVEQSRAEQSRAEQSRAEGRRQAIYSLAEAPFGRPCTA